MTEGRRRLSLLVCAIPLLVALAIAAPASRAADCGAADRVPTAATMEAAREATLCLLNNERVSRSLQPFTRQSQLEEAATRYSQSMIVERFFSHVTPLGEVLHDRLAPYIRAALGWKVAENLGWGENVRATPRAMVDAWMHSDSHRTNMLNARYDEVGIGIVNGTPTGLSPARSATYTVEFGTRASAPPKATKAVSGRVSAATSRRIKTQCRREARRAHPRSRSRQNASYKRCVTKKLRRARKAT